MNQIMTTLNRFAVLSTVLPRKIIPNPVITEPCYKCMKTFCFCKDSIKNCNDINRRKQIDVWKQIYFTEYLLN